MQFIFNIYLYAFFLPFNRYYDNDGSLRLLVAPCNVAVLYIRAYWGRAGGRAA